MAIVSSVEKPRIPFVFLDTNFFINLVKDRHLTKKTTYYQEIVNLYSLLQNLILHKRVVCPIVHQDKEYDLGNYWEEMRSFQLKLFGGYKAVCFDSTEKEQVKIAAKNYFNKAENIVYDAQSLFRKELSELERNFSNEDDFIDCHFPIKSNVNKDQLADRWKSLQTTVESDKKSFKKQLKIEILTIRDFIFKAILAKINGKPINDWTEDEKKGEKLFMEYMILMPKETTPKDLINFLGSDFYSGIPYVNVYSSLIAQMLTKKERIKSSDLMDFHQAAQILPFCSYYLTDGPMKTKLTAQTLGFDVKYDVKIYAFKEIEILIENLKREQQKNK